MRFAFIAAEKATHSVTILCRCLHVTRSGFYAWLRRGLSARAQRDVVLRTPLTTASTRPSSRVNRRTMRSASPSGRELRTTERAFSARTSAAALRAARGKVINMASILGAVGLENQLPYASSKGGVIQMTKVMALEWARHGIQVNAIGPTYFETPLVAALRNDPERFRFINERTPMGRWGQPEELEGTVIFLASKASDFITGQTVFVDGGWTAW